MATEVKAELGTENLEVKKRRKLSVFDVNAESETVHVYYKEQQYYINGEEEVILREENKHYTSNYAELEASDVGIAIRAMIEARLALTDPNNPPS